MSLMVSCRLLGGIGSPLDFNQWQVVLVRQQTSDCAGSDVPNVDSPLVGGMLWATQLFDGNTSVKLAITARSSDPTLGNEPFRRSEKSIIASMPRYRTVPSILVWPSNSCTARRLPVRR
jgi:hypothetical protein